MRKKFVNLKSGVQKGKFFNIRTGGWKRREEENL